MKEKENVYQQQHVIISIDHRHQQQKFVSPLGQTQKIIGRRTTPPAPATSED